jgi:hypothetical protein
MFYKRALGFERELGYQAGVATELANIGLILVDKGQYERAVPVLAESLAILLALCVVRGPGQALYGLSRCDDQLGRDRIWELLRRAGMADSSIADQLDRVDQVRLKRPWKRPSRPVPFVLPRPASGTSF